MPEHMTATDHHVRLARELEAAQERFNLEPTTEARDAMFEAARALLIDSQIAATRAA